MKQPLSAVAPIEPAGIDYRLERQRVLEGFGRGELSRENVCDAQFELRRNAAHCGTELGELCPVCEDNEVVAVAYVFGPRLPKSGRCVTTAAERERLSRREGEFTEFVVEVCAACGWNHLLHSCPLPTP